MRHARVRIRCRVHFAGAHAPYFQERPMSYWQNKVAIVTGGSSGLGLALAQRLFADGGTVVMAARDQTRLQAAVEIVRANRTEENAAGPVKGTGIERR